ncbi:MAG: hypothetical protein ACLS4Z_03185 [Christensenellaceae bacterium]
MYYRERETAGRGRALGVKWFEYLQEIRRKAFNNAEAFGRSGAVVGVEPGGGIFGRGVRSVEGAGTSGNVGGVAAGEEASASACDDESVSGVRRRGTAAATSFYNKKYYLKNLRQILELNRKWRQENRENAGRKMQNMGQILGSLGKARNIAKE